MVDVVEVVLVGGIENEVVVESDVVVVDDEDELDPVVIVEVEFAYRDADLIELTSKMKVLVCEL